MRWQYRGFYLYPTLATPQWQRVTDGGGYRNATGGYIMAALRPRGMRRIIVRTPGL